MIFDFLYTNEIQDKILNKYSTALHEAVQKDNINIIKLLLKNPKIDTKLRNDIFH